MGWVWRWNNIETGIVRTQMYLLTHGPKIQKDQSLRKLVSCGSQMYQMKEEKSNGIRHAERRKSENTNHNNNHLYLEMSLFCTIVKSTPSRPPSLCRTRRTPQPWSCCAVLPALELRGLGGGSSDQIPRHWLAKALFWNSIPNQSRSNKSSKQSGIHEMFICHHCPPFPNVLSPQSTFPTHETFPQLVHLNKDYDIPAELTQRNLNLNLFTLPFLSRQANSSRNQDLFGIKLPLRFHQLNFIYIS